MNHSITEIATQIPENEPQASPGMIAIPHQNVTIVSGYFNVPSKRSHDDYLPWIQSFTSIKDNLVIFTSKELVPFFKKLRENRTNTRILSISLQEFRVVQDFGGMEFWSNQTVLDPERLVHTKECYVIWNEKSYFIQRAMEWNPFGSEFFAWMDIGYMRDSLLENKRIIRFVPSDLTHQQAMFLDVTSFGGQEITSLGGGFIGGYKEGLELWIKEYYDVLKLNRHVFVGKDQPWMFQACLQNPGLCFLVQPSGEYGDPWFYMSAYLHDFSQPEFSERAQNRTR